MLSENNLLAQGKEVVVVDEIEVVVLVDVVLVDVVLVDVVLVDVLVLVATDVLVTVVVACVQVSKNNYYTFCNVSGTEWIL